MDVPVYIAEITNRIIEKAYGDIGKNYIHVHHIKPLSEITQEYKVDCKNDLIPIVPTVTQ